VTGGYARGPLLDVWGDDQWVNHMGDRYYVTDSDVSSRFPRCTRANVGEVFPDPVTPLSSDTTLWLAGPGICCIHEMRMPMRELGRGMVGRGAFDEIEGFGFLKAAQQ
jgi:hypothetical protein